MSCIFNSKALLAPWKTRCLLQAPIGTAALPCPGHWVAGLSCGQELAGGRVSGEGVGTNPYFAAERLVNIPK